MARGLTEKPSPVSFTENGTDPGNFGEGWAEIYATVHTLHAQGLPVATIARQLGISRPTVYAYLRRAKLATTSWLFVTFDTDGEVCTTHD